VPQNFWTFLRLQKDIMDILFEVFRLPVPIWTSDFQEALASVGKQDNMLYSA
jgi:hypothetical protein